MPTETDMRTHTVRLHSAEGPSTGKFRETESRMAVTGDGGGEERGAVLKGHRVSV